MATGVASTRSVALLVALLLMLLQITLADDKSPSACPPSYAGIRYSIGSNTTASRKNKFGALRDQVVVPRLKRLYKANNEQYRCKISKIDPFGPKTAAVHLGFTCFFLEPCGGGSSPILVGLGKVVGGVATSAEAVL